MKRKNQNNQELIFDAISRVMSGEPVFQVSEKFGLGEQTLRDWLKVRRATSLAYRIAVTGFAFDKYLNDGNDCQRSRVYACRMKRMDLENFPDPSFPIEMDICKCKKFDEIAMVLHRYKKSYGSFFHEYREHCFSPVAHKVAQAAFNLIKGGEKKSFLHYFFVGLTIRAVDRESLYCSCCGWRVIRAPNFRRCSVCYPMHKNSGVSLTTKYRIQQNIFAELKESSQYKTFIKHRHYGENYFYLLATGFVNNPGAPMTCDREDFTDVNEYRAAKEDLAREWKKFSQNRKNYKQRSTKDQLLLSLALKGHSKSFAAKEVGMSRAGVTKACKRNPELAKAFAT